MQFVRKFSRNILPVQYPGKLNNKKYRYFMTFSLPRSGQHLIINWICYHLVSSIHYNCCSFLRYGYHYELIPVNGRVIVYSNSEIQSDSIGCQRKRYLIEEARKKPASDNVLFSIENLEIDDILIKKMIKTMNVNRIIIVRDPFNWLASVMNHKQLNVKFTIHNLYCCLASLKQILATDRNDILIVSYNKFVIDREYRLKLLEKINIPLNLADSDANLLSFVPNFAGGSSFSEKQISGSDLQTKVVSRYKEMLDNEQYMNLLQDQELISISNNFFGDLPYFKEIESAFRL